MNVTLDTRCDELLKEVGFPGKLVFLNPVAKDPARRELTIGQIIALDKNWNGPSMLEGMQAFADCALRENFYHDIYKGTELEGETALMAMIVPGRKRFVVVCAGGGYGSCCTMVEAFPLAKRLNDLGISAFVLYYRVGEQAHYPNPMDDLAAAIAYIRKNAEQLGVDAENYGIMGFSAGGHLAAIFGTETVGWKKYGLPKPGFLFLGYPVITMLGEEKSGTRSTLLAENSQNPEIQRLYSVECQANGNYPPTFVWQCTGDRSVSIENSRMLARLLEREGVPYRFEEFDAVAHSWGLGTGTLADGWLDRAVAFWNTLSE